jgi:hypothetical protein
LEATRAGKAGKHSQLLRFVTAPAAVNLVRRRRVFRHVKRCRPIRGARFQEATMQLRSRLAAAAAVVGLAAVAAYAPAASAGDVGFSLSFGGPGYAFSAGNVGYYGGYYAPAPVVVTPPPVVYRSYRPYYAPIVVRPYPAWRSYHVDRRWDRHDHRRDRHDRWHDRDDRRHDRHDRRGR